jgi:hypothetical protein
MQPLRCVRGPQVEYNWSRGIAPRLYSGGARLEISDGTPATLTEVFLGFPQSLQETAGIVPRLDNNRFLPNPIQLYHSSDILPTAALY